ncbi:hypothetical protein UFOVP437_21 [uncultured Caudovirales phage]|uniref:Uncharacterized protein n=1 Tax=uncultured Caudovirales phage TaxID=2100421 RepID=A0A6J5MBS3_9CAUD|nr:hypothetical protein UFOVP437_21 [uncultured Caudovirales phage]
MIPNFAIDQNLKVEFLVPDSEGNTFILGISELGGTDVLGGFGEFILGVSLLGSDAVLAPSSGLKWQEVTCQVANANISVGGSLQDSINFQPEPGTANLTLQSYDLDPTVNKNIRASTKFRVRLEDDELDRILFQGFIDTIDVTYYPQGPNLIKITGFDAYKSLVNSRFAVWDTTSFGTHIHDDEVWELIGIYSGLGLSPASFHVGGQIPVVDETNVQVSSVVNEVLQVGNGLVWLDQDTEELVVQHRTFTSASSPTTYIIGNNHGDDYHLCMSEINVFSDADAVYNSLYVTLQSDPLITTFRKDQDSIDLYGESAIDVTLNTTNLNQLNNWADRVFNHRSANQVNMVQTPTIDRLGTLTEAAVFTPGMTVGVSYTKDTLNIVGFYTIIKVSHRIDVDNWFTTLELWKEA